MSVPSNIEMILTETEGVKVSAAAEDNKPKKVSKKKQARERLRAGPIQAE
jgi:hypothetical protein